MGRFKRVELAGKQVEFRLGQFLEELVRMVALAGLRRGTGKWALVRSDQ